MSASPGHDDPNPYAAPSSDVGGGGQPRVVSWAYAQVLGSCHLVIGLVCFLYSARGAPYGTGWAALRVSAGVAVLVSNVLLAVGLFRLRPRARPLGPLFVASYALWLLAVGVTERWQ